MICQVHVRKDDISQAELDRSESAGLAEGAVRLAVESFSVTSNNVTYAAVGDGFGYWNFFPAPEGKGIVPMWGHARVSESNHDDIAVGERVYGYLPMATHLDVLPGKVTPAGFVDATQHRQPMSPVYNQYTRLAADPEHDPTRENERMIFGPLFKTGFLIEYFMRANDWFGAKQAVLTSASSKTAMGLASVVRERSPGIARIGLTAAGHVAFVEGTGLYDRVLAYDDVGDLPRVASVSIDFAGNPNLLRRVHETLGDLLGYSCLVGATHVDARDGGPGGASDMPGPPPTLFFAPDHAVTLFKQVGQEETGRLMAASWHTFLGDLGDSVAVEMHDGTAAAADLFVRTAKGEIDPATSIVVRP